MIFIGVDGIIASQYARIDCNVTDDTDVTAFLMVKNIAENFTGSFAHNYVYDKGFIDSIPPPVIDKLQKLKVFQLRLGIFCSIMNRCAIIEHNKLLHVPLKKPFILDPITLTPIPPSRAHVVTPSHSTIDATVGTPNIFSLLDHNASSMSKDDDLPKKYQFQSKSHHD
ncbi:hypothetical protein SADUNF_Sadunf19G0063500 [Salix dunnii]|uniref:Uncharacterized protein n=1 Tax=Salix dunnii TaxID=1413687 RepID=A0A835MCI8_9ROSI|nr:hypothetical protein SADUNF_Sadunf19G0063500 [Salix dunnii]